MLIMKTVAIVVQHRGSILANEFTEYRIYRTSNSINCAEQSLDMLKL
jgi:hypothetical protein